MNNRQMPASDPDVFPRGPSTLGGLAVSELVGVAQQLVRTFDDAEERLLRQYEITAAEWRIMQALDRFGWLSISDAARKIGVSRQAAQRVVNSLAGKAIVKVAQHPNDKRADAMALRRKGREVFREATRARSLWLESLGTTADVGLIEVGEAQKLMKATISAIQAKHDLA